MEGEGAGGGNGGKGGMKRRKEGRREDMKDLRMCRKGGNGRMEEPRQG